MLTKKIGIPLALSVLLLAGCSDRDSLLQGVIDSNTRVSMVLSSYTEAKQSAEPLELAIRKMFQEGIQGELSFKEGVDGTGYIPYEIKNPVSDLAQRITDYIKDNEEAVTSRYSFVDNTLMVKYFVDDSTGKVEQLFFLQLPNGYTGGFVVNWLGGAYLETTPIF